jgi:hypothetical protein
MLKLSPELTAFDCVSAAEPRKVPEVDADHSETYAYVSVVDTAVHATATVLEMAPPDATVPKVDCWRVVLPAGLDVPAAPGSPKCICTHTAAFAYEVFRQSALSRLFFTVSLSAMMGSP